MKLIRVVILLLFIPAALGASDFDFALNFHNSLKGQQDVDPVYSLNIDFWPRYTLLIGDNNDLVISAGLSFRYDDDMHFIPELLQTHFTHRFGSSAIRIGRMIYSDPLSYVAEGLFDGFQFFTSSEMGRFNIGAWYTGLLYKKNANITMTKEEIIMFDAPIDFDDFSNTYFAPARLVGAIGWEHPSLGEYLHLSAALVGQFDLRDTNVLYNSQYFIAKAAIPKAELLIELGGSAAISQTTGDKEETDVSFAGEAGFSYILPTSFLSRFSVKGKYASGKMEDSYEAFNPITTTYAGNILEYRFSALSILSLNYTARLAPSFGAALTASYFIRNDLGTIVNYPVTPGSDGHLLGAEAYLQMVFSPVSDLQFNFGAGAFMPSFGDAGADEPVRWKADLKVIIAF